MDNFKLTKGSAVSLDIIGSTDKFKKTKNPQKLYQIVDKVQKAIEYAISSTNGIVVHYTGDGALVFFEDIFGMTSVEQAIRFGLDFSNIWRRWKKVFDKLNDYDFRIAIDYGKVVMRDDGGLWSGLALNRACKIRIKGNDENRVIITNRVFKRIQNTSLFKEVFFEIPKKLIPKKHYAKKLYSTRLQINEKAQTIIDTPLKKHEPEKTLEWAVCVLGIDKKPYQIEIVLESINQQSYVPKCVFLLSDKEAIQYLGKNKYHFQIVFIDKDEPENTNRAVVRNMLQDRAIRDDTNFDVICFLDGDTVVKRSVFEKTYNIFCTNKNCMISAPRIDFDYSLGMTESVLFSKLFLDYETLQYSTYSGTRTSFYSEPLKKDKRNNVSAAYSLKFLPSYLLFVPVHIINELGVWDVNFEGWGEEDIDYTFRAYKKGYSMIMPSIPNYLTMHLSHEIGNSDSLLTNAEYLLSKFPELREERTGFYKALGF